MKNLRLLLGALCALSMCGTTARAQSRPPAPADPQPVIKYDAKGDTAWVKTPEIYLTEAPTSLHVYAYYVTRGRKIERPETITVHIVENHPTKQWVPLSIARFQAGGKTYEYEYATGHHQQRGYMNETASMRIPLADYEEMMRAGPISFLVHKTTGYLAYEWLTPLKMILKTVPPK